MSTRDKITLFLSAIHTRTDNATLTNLSLNLSQICVKKTNNIVLKHAIQNQTLSNKFVWIYMTHQPKRSNNNHNSTQMHNFYFAPLNLSKFKCLTNKNITHSNNDKSKNKSTANLNEFDDKTIKKNSIEDSKSCKFGHKKWTHKTKTIVDDSGNEDIDLS